MPTNCKLSELIEGVNNLIFRFNISVGKIRENVGSNKAIFFDSHLLRVLFKCNAMYTKDNLTTSLYRPTSLIHCVKDLSIQLQNCCHIENREQ